MTVRKKLESMLVERGLFPQQAETVFKLAIPKFEEVVPNHGMSWNSPAEHYPDNLYQLIFGVLKEVAHDWVATNYPRAWFLPALK